MEDKNKVNSANKISIGILRETLSNWERRAPLSPVNCEKLITNGAYIAIQPSMTRCFTDLEYEKVGVDVKEDLSDCNTIIGILEPDVHTLIPERTYLFFSNMTKGHLRNTHLLDKILQQRIRLIDYECIRERKDKVYGKKLVSFGWFAGIAGTINLFKGLGELLLSRQISTPFVFTKLSYMYSDLEDAISNLETLGSYIKEQHLPEQICPFVVAVIGNGQVSRGVQKALKCLPHKFITPNELTKNELPKVTDLVYVVIFELQHLYYKNSDCSDNSHNPDNFDNSDFIKSPELYSSCFANKYLKYCHCIINALYWQPRFPRIITRNDLKVQVSNNLCKLIAISDIACDLKGNIEILREYNNYRQPFSIYEPIREKFIQDIDNSTKEGLIYHAIPELATSFPYDATEYFSSILEPYIMNIAQSAYPNNSKNEDLVEEIREACITSGGALTDHYKNIFKYAEETKTIGSLSSQSSANNYLLSVKMKGDLFDSGLFNLLIKYFSTHKIEHKISFLNIGESTELPSVFYFDAFGAEKAKLFDLMNFIKENSEILNCEYGFIKQNIL